MNLLTITKHKLLYSLFLVLAFLLLQNHVGALPSTLPPISALQSNSGTCGNPSLLSNNLLAPQPITGKLYAKLPSTESAMTVYLYSQPIFGNTCTPLGSAEINSNTWTYVGQINDNAPASTIIAEGSNLEAPPYQPAIELLSVPSSSPCIVKGNSCLATYGGYAGSLQPNIISTDTSQIAMYVAQPFSDVAISSVNYYADGSFIYSSKKLLPVNRDYLDGGMHSIQIQVNFSHGETFSVNQSINMGPDWTGALLIKSTFYRSKSKVGFFVIIGAIVLVIVSALALARYIYKLRKFKREHGLTKKNLRGIDNIKPENDDSEPPMHIG